MSDTRKPAVASSRLYAEHYRRLNEIAERLRKGGPDDIDRLVEDFRDGMQSHRICLERLDAIRAEIDQEMDRVRPDVG